MFLELNFMQHEFHLTLEFSCGPCQSVIYSRFPSQNAIHGDLWELTIRSEEDFRDQSIISKSDIDFTKV